MSNENVDKITAVGVEILDPYLILLSIFELSPRSTTGTLTWWSSLRKLP